MEYLNKELGIVKYSPDDIKALYKIKQGAYELTCGGVTCDYCPIYFNNRCLHALINDILVEEGLE